MIISASRRTDIPAFYSDWFYNRIKEGYVLVRNPFNLHYVSKVPLSLELVDCFVFWSKNPANMIDNLQIIDRYPYYFQFTLNPYDDKVEKNVPKKSEIIDTFRRLSDKIGPNRVIWRYDPIIITEAISEEYHYKYFEVLASKLQDYTSKCIISFVDFYPKAKKGLGTIGAFDISDEDKIRIAKRIGEIAEAYSLKIETCAEEIDLSQFGIEHGKCIDPNLIKEISGRNIKDGKDKNQRKACGCASSVDIGAYNTCMHRCIYCYANYSSNVVNDNMTRYDVNSPLLCSSITDEDVIAEKNS
ncbi:Domain of unknown function DUF1848 [Thermoanaerobacterium thermosaccharolyticum DSM 571]|uniref:DNA repair photolyase n=1 Tax=Thermoanaerobacterium thermosaccharolyticum (strain ATCC 7956 / DSM 571 / NCIMB 9385 / NCA 3814 / NCTC 13789 / WDCM 00135 / 2032) TaxID=580327 RepID=D9TLZ2_THETC|nr:DUF1848 domain-containing protein [Thermoanaerobacterium thermosaccharolyticum]ADL68372.1 Domain of unknown function DUF1848 [Thermoanaerobacterium thermosaccharolyticum DSM 571]